MAASGAAKSLRTEKLDEAQASARSCAGRPDFLPCDGLSARHGRCFKLHWCCHLGWCHCKYVYQPMTSVGQLPSTAVPPGTTMDLSVALAERFLKMAPCFRSPPHLQSPKYCVIADLFVDDYIVKRINGKMCYVQRPAPPDPPHPPPASSDTSAPKVPPLPSTPPQTPTPATPEMSSGQQVAMLRPPRQGPPSSPATGNAQHKHPCPLDKLKGPKIDHCSSPSSSEDSGINAVDVYYLESCEEDMEEEEPDDDELSTDGNSSLWDQDECSLLSPSKSTIEIIEKIETTV
ncbi:hypothetical protein NHX12_006792 [Muraenolepis orangiensis]|uniref:Uncharacterized protein n=1 Tax=Muraenolepis orangiensis TaxID=630683 RepID=A0A9Q0DMY1_9TELE|nr:hypothetical protein NHX12_006792 [Muraenolepis orangiensis]